MAQGLLGDNELGATQQERSVGFWSVWFAVNVLIGAMAA
jgi:hypothetical protein